MTAFAQLCRPLSRALITLLTSILGFRCAPPQALCCHPLRGLFARCPSIPIRLRVDDDARPDFLRTFGYYSFTRLQSIFDNPHRAGTVADLNGADFDSVIAAHDGHLVTTLQLTDCSLRHQQGFFSG